MYSLVLLCLCLSVSCRLQPRMTMARTIKLYKLPDMPRTPGIRPLEKRDVPQVCASPYKQAGSAHAWRVASFCLHCVSTGCHCVQAVTVCPASEHLILQPCSPYDEALHDNMATTVLASMAFSASAFCICTSSAKPHQAYQHASLAELLLCR